MKNNLLSIMSEKNVSIVKLSKITGISRYTISALVNEKSTCNVHTLMQICDALNVTPNDVLITKKRPNLRQQVRPAITNLINKHIVKQIRR